MRLIRRLALPFLCAAALAACNKQASVDNDAPLAYVPADTPYAYANLEPTPAEVTNAWSQRMKGYWPQLIDMYSGMLNRAAATKTDPDTQRGIKIGNAILDEFRTDDLWSRLREMGIKPDARFAMYGVGIVPVIRVELADPAAFKNEVAKIEAKVGEKIPAGRVADQDFWRIGDDKVSGVAAIEGKHLVLTILPSGANDALKQTILGLTKPAQNLGAAGTLQTLAKTYNYANFGEGFIDFVRLTDRLTSPASGTDAEFATAVGMPWPGSDAACRTDFLDIAHKFPRAVAGVEELAVKRVRVGFQMEMDASIAQPLSAALGSAPGTGAAGQGIMDIALSLPVLKLKDFWLKQADAVAAKPYTCPQLASLNEGFASSRAKADTTVPPPFSDLTGARFTLDTFSMSDAATIPDFTGKMLTRTSNPGALFAMAQLAAKPLQTMTLKPDGVAVPLPAGAVPFATQPLAVAMSADALAISAGAGEDATLGAYLAAPASKDAVFLRMYFTGKIYAIMSQAMAKAKAAMPPDQQATFETQQKLFASYEQFIKSADITFVATPTGIAMHEVVEQN